ncbi:MAG: flagellar biosynthesis protein FliQ [Acidothermus cellulolyticus]|nr:flagellar biosynthesis protein FliQ [Acidothermus cellulolyticus]MCL6550651.1 flagellar biosynthesis protein FliQ [Acidothermus cellulolyticus]
MTDTAVIHLAMQAMVVAAKLCAPILLTSLLVGFGISLFQAATQVQEFTLSFVPKILAVGIAIVVSGHWMLITLVDFTHQLFRSLPGLISGG